MRRHRSQGTWLPVLGTDVEVEGELIARTTRSLEIDLVGDELNALTVVSPVIFDDPAEPNEFSDSANLNTLVGNEYLLKRIVGKVWVSPTWRWPIASAAATELAQGPQAVLVSCGFFVARAADAAVGETSPIGGAAAWASDYNPLNRNQCREPWIWRRSWILGSPVLKEFRASHYYSGSSNTMINGVGLYSDLPSTNAGYGSVLDGPHIDAKSKRRVGNDDRLWFSAAALPWTPDSTYQFGLPVPITFDVRVFGSIRKAHNRSTF